MLKMHKKSQTFIKTFSIIAQLVKIFDQPLQCMVIKRGKNWKGIMANLQLMIRSDSLKLSVGLEIFHFVCWVRYDGICSRLPASRTHFSMFICILECLN